MPAINYVSLGEALYARIAEAVRPTPVNRVFDGWYPRVGECHANVEMIACLDPHFSVVRGWLYIGGQGGAVFNAHSVVADKDGALFDFTPADPLVSEDLRLFIRHPGDEDDFQRVVIRGKQAQIIYAA